MGCGYWLEPRSSFNAPVHPHYALNGVAKDPFTQYLLTMVSSDLYLVAGIREEIQFDWIFIRNLPD